jgi:hypothetical protein
LWTFQSVLQGSGELIQEAERSVESTKEVAFLQDIWKSLLLGLEKQAGKVVALEDACTVHEASGKVLKVDSSVRVNSVDITAKSEGVWVGGPAEQSIGDNVWDGVLVGRWSAVPVLGDFSPARGSR